MLQGAHAQHAAAIRHHRTRSARARRPPGASLHTHAPGTGLPQSLAQPLTLSGAHRRGLSTFCGSEH